MLSGVAPQPLVGSVRRDRSLGVPLCQRAVGLWALWRFVLVWLRVLALPGLAPVSSSALLPTLLQTAPRQVEHVWYPPRARSWQGYKMEETRPELRAGVLQQPINALPTLVDPLLRPLQPGHPGMRR